MRPTIPLVIAMLCVGLAGCFTSDAPLLTDANSVAPYRTIAFRDEHAPTDTVVTRAGTDYVGDTPDGMLAIRFLAMDRPGWFVVQVSGPAIASGPAVFYAVVRFDAANHRAYEYKSIASDADIRPGLRSCGDAVCIDDLKAYAASAEASADTGHVADATFIVTVQ